MFNSRRALCDNLSINQLRLALARFARARWLGDPDRHNEVIWLLRGDGHADQNLARVDLRAHRSR